MPKDNSLNTIGIIGLILFAMLFAGIGLAVCYFSGWAKKLSEEQLLKATYVDVKFNFIRDDGIPYSTQTALEALITFNSHKAIFAMEHNTFSLLAHNTARVFPLKLANSISHIVINEEVPALTILVKPITDILVEDSEEDCDLE